MSDEWSGGDAVAVTRKNSYTGLVNYNNITSSEVTENKGYPSSSCSMVLTYNTNDSSVNQDVPQGKTIISLGIDPDNFLYTRTSVWLQDFLRSLVITDCRDIIICKEACISVKVLTVIFKIL